jgi:hypothetical protein
VKSTTVCHSIFPGRYRVTRKAQIDGRPRSRSIDCTNPAYAFTQLDEWEAHERMYAAITNLRQALSDPKRRSKVKRVED